MSSEPVFTCTRFLGIDIGSMYISMVGLDDKLTVTGHAYMPHRGKIRPALIEMEKSFDLSGVSRAGAIGGSRFFDNRVESCDAQTSVIVAARHYFPEARAILHVGAEKFQLIRFDADGHFMFSATNTSCAAGTGSFLDQQALRLGLTDMGEFCRTALRHTGEIPDIASRCAVFAKTDLIHAQQSGFSLPAICNSLCRGLAKNIADTLDDDETIHPPVIFTGGVALNRVVALYLEQMLGTGLVIHPYAHLFGAIGAALQLQGNDHGGRMQGVTTLGSLFATTDERKVYVHPPLEWHGREEAGSNTSTYSPARSGHDRPVEMHLYGIPDHVSFRDVYLGIDVGSTSTKAIVTDTGGTPLAGFYTYTSGKPLKATQAILEALDDLSAGYSLVPRFRGVASTGSGRKFIGKIIGADLVINEITAHARAAVDLNPLTDTIIEIGGQDAKFTLLRDGRVTFAQMNSVCAAGTGSFIEEQAQRLGVSLDDYSRLVKGVRSPLASDRCTVFMERDVNQYLGHGYTVPEILSCVLYSVTENYLKKVATESAIGNNICFQGATARNRALVAAFEQRLGKRIFVSDYCHLAGALGAALMVRDEIQGPSAFRGLQLCSREIDMRNEKCSFCNNQCKISIATIGEEEVAYGFLCGRDYNTHRFIDRNLSGFNLLREAEKVQRFPLTRKNRMIRIGIPAALHLFDEMNFWKCFFSHLPVEVMTSEKYRDAVKEGKRIAGAEFCAPVDAFYGHVQHLFETADYIFAPVYLESKEREGGGERYYCHYTQFISSVVSGIRNRQYGDRLLSPLLNFSTGMEKVKKELWKTFDPIIPGGISYETVHHAFEDAMTVEAETKAALRSMFEREFRGSEDISVVLLGRPYIVMSPHMNKGIPEIFSSMGVKTFWQEMIPVRQSHKTDEAGMAREFPWHYASRILEVTSIVAATPRLYPVLITAFKCSPDSFLMTFFKRRMEEYGKPYLILQIDEHDSNVGYETRVEAAVHSFRNHCREGGQADRGMIVHLPSQPDSIHARKNLAFPQWDPLVCPLLVNNLVRSGLNAFLLESNDLTLRKSMAYNTGQCIPINAIALEFIELMERYDLRPEETMLWIPRSTWTCNIRMYQPFIQTLLQAYGRGMEKASVYVGEITHLDVSLNTCYRAFLAYLTGGLIRKAGCTIRPYELEKGLTDHVISQGMEQLKKSFLGKGDLESTVAGIVRQLRGIRVAREEKPRVAIFGDLYVRDNDLVNQNLIKTIEEAGGEVITVPYSDYVKITAATSFRRRSAEGKILEVVGQRAILNGSKQMEKIYYRHFGRILGKMPVIRSRKYESYLSHFRFHLLQNGESFDNLLKIFYIVDNYPDVRLFVQASPAFCCPSLITEAMRGEIRRFTGIPVVSITYDGTHEFKNDVLFPYIRFLSQHSRARDLSRIAGEEGIVVD